MSAPATTYDELPYDDKPLLPTHPDNIAGIATFNGMMPPRPEHCRVLEIGCASGQNLFAMAVTLPHARFTGIDQSPRQIADGIAEVEALALPNVKLRAMDVMHVDPSFGAFDYVIAHGIYSWVPRLVQDKILEVCARNLAPNGVAYVSYNTYPGWHQRGMVREMMAYHVRDTPDPRKRIEKARAFLSFLVEGQPKESTRTYAKILQDEAKLLGDAADSYLFHEHLEEVNQPLYFSEFMERAKAQGLQYVGEARAHRPLSLFPAATQAALAQIADDPVRQEQYLDFLRNRTFRWTLLCHKDLAVDRDPPTHRMAGFWYSGMAKPATPDPDVTTADALEFRSEYVSVSVNQPIVKAALLEVGAAWPLPLTFETLASRVWDRLKRGCAQPLTSDGLPAALADTLMTCYWNNLVKLGVCAPAFTTDVSERPRTSVLARRQGARKQKYVSNLRHAYLQVADQERQLLSLLDGSKDREKLAQDMASVLSPEEMPKGWLDATLTRLAGLALLASDASL